MSDNSALAHVLSNFSVNVLDPSKIAPLKPLEPVAVKDINFVCSKRADALSSNAQAWADEARGTYEYYAEMYQEESKKMKKEELIKKLNQAVDKSSNDFEYSHMYIYNGVLYGTNDDEHFEQISQIFNFSLCNSIWKVQEVK